MSDWAYSAAIFGIILALFPLIYALRRTLWQWKNKKQSEHIVVDNDNKDNVRIEDDVEFEKAPDKEKSDGNLTYYKTQHLLMLRGTIDLITYRLSLIESSIYKDVNPMPHLTDVEYQAAVKQMKDVVRHLKCLPEVQMPETVTMPIDLY